MHDTDQAALAAARAVLAGPTRQPARRRRLPDVSIPRPPRPVTGAAGVVAVFLVGFLAGTTRNDLAAPPWSVLLGAIGVIAGFAVGVIAGRDPLASASSPAAEHTKAPAG